MCKQRNVFILFAVGSFQDSVMKTSEHTSHSTATASGHTSVFARAWAFTLNSTGAQMSLCQTASRAQKIPMSSERFCFSEQCPSNIYPSCVSFGKLQAEYSTPHVPNQISSHFRTVSFDVICLYTDISTGHDDLVSRQVLSVF